MIAKDAKVNAVIVNAIEVDYASKRFGTQQEIRDIVALSVLLDPLPNTSEDDKMSRLSNKGITQEAYVISSNIYSFIQRALNENKKFHELELKKQKELMQKYAQEVIEANDTKKKIIDETMNGLLGNNGSSGEPNNGMTKSDEEYLEEEETEVV